LKVYRRRCFIVLACRANFQPATKEKCGFYNHSRRRAKQFGRARRICPKVQN